VVNQKNKGKTALVEKTHVKTVHIDTSLQIERCKAPKKADVVERALEPYRFKSTSTYAKLEFKRAWLQRLAYIYAACSDVTRVEELFGYVDDKLSSHPGHARQLTTCIQAIVSYLSKIRGQLTPEAQLIRFRSHVRTGIMGAYAWWDSSVTHQYHGTECKRAIEEPKELPDGKIDVTVPQCRRGKMCCGFHIFFKENMREFMKLKQAIEKLGQPVSNQIKGWKDAIEEAERDPLSLQDSKTCKKLSDAIIAIDGLDMECFAANNDKEWIFLSKVFEKELLNPVRNAKEK
jgi:hypothetical protein